MQSYIRQPCVPLPIHMNPMRQEEQIATPGRNHRPWIGIQGQNGIHWNSTLRGMLEYIGVIETTENIFKFEGVNRSLSCDYIRLKK